MVDLFLYWRGFTYVNDDTYLEAEAWGKLLLRFVDIVDTLHKELTHSVVRADRGREDVRFSYLVL